LVCFPVPEFHDCTLVNEGTEENGDALGLVAGQPIHHTFNIFTCFVKYVLMYQKGAMDMPQTSWHAVCLNQIRLAYGVWEVLKLELNSTNIILQDNHEGNFFFATMLFMLLFILSYLYLH
ncbi:hypothetical protein ACJX0J_042380, partial [Zea mays]